MVVTAGRLRQARGPLLHVIGQWIRVHRLPGYIVSDDGCLVRGWAGDVGVRGRGWPELGREYSREYPWFVLLLYGMEKIDEMKEPVAGRLSSDMDEALCCMDDRRSVRRVDSRSVEDTHYCWG